jgi:hypothetical protein
MPTASRSADSGSLREPSSSGRRAASLTQVPESLRAQHSGAGRDRDVEVPQCHGPAVPGDVENHTVPTPAPSRGSKPNAGALHGILGGKVFYFMTNPA